MTDRNSDVLLTRRQLAERLATTVGRLANDASKRVGVPFIKINGSVRYSLADVAAFEDANRVGALAA